MENLQNIIILVLILVCTYLYFDRKSLKYWKDYYLKESDKFSKDYFQMLDINFELESKLNKTEKIIFQQKEELLTRKPSKKK